MLTIDKVSVEQFTASEKDLLEAIHLKCANCYGAMSMVNALGGIRTNTWMLCHTYTLKRLLDEAEVLGLDLSQLKTAVHNTPVTESMYYKRAKGIVTESEFNELFKQWREG